MPRQNKSECIKRLGRELGWDFTSKDKAQLSRLSADLLFRLGSKIGQQTAARETIKPLGKSLRRREHVGFVGADEEE